MGCDISIMRRAVSDVYTGLTWQEKVARMSDNQIIAIYNSFLSKGKFDKKPVTKPRTEYQDPRKKYGDATAKRIIKAHKKNDEPIAVQMTLDL